MTDRDSLARDYASQDSEEDPLEELARIVSEGIQAPPEPVAPKATEAEASSPQAVEEDLSQELEAELGADLDADEMEDDLAAALAMELDTAAVSTTPQITSDTAQAKESSQKPFEEVTADVASEDSLEDQLLAELGNEESDSPPPDQFAAARAAVPPKPSFNSDFSAAFRNAENTARVTPRAPENQSVSQPDLAPVAAPAGRGEDVPAKESVEQRQAPMEGQSQPQPAQSSKHGMPVTTPTLAQSNARDASVEAPPAPSSDNASIADSAAVSEAAPAESRAAKLQSRPPLFGSNLDLSAAFHAELGKRETAASQRIQAAVEKSDVADAAQSEAAPVARQTAPDGFDELDQAIGNLGVLPKPAKLDDAAIEQQFADAFAKDLGIELGNREAATQADELPDASETEEWAGSDESVQISDEPEPNDFQPDSAGWLTADSGDADQVRAQQAAAGGAPEFPGDPGVNANYAEDHSIYNEGDVEETSEPSKSRMSGGGFKLAAAALGVALVLGLGVVSYAYFLGGDTPSEPVIVKAGEEPVKVKPDDPGGLTVANQDKAAYERVRGEFGEEARQQELLTTTEEPVEVAPRVVSSNGKAEERLSAEQDASAPASNVDLLEPRRVKTVTVTRDGVVLDSNAFPGSPTISNNIDSFAPANDPTTIDGARSTGDIAVPIPRPAETEPAASQPQASEVPLEVAPQPLAPRTGETRTIRSPIAGETAAIQPRSLDAEPEPAATSLETTNSIAPQPVSVEPAPIAAVETRPSAATTAPPAASSEWVVQIASQRSAEDAQATFQNMQQRFPDVLSGRQMSVQRADLDDRGIFFRVRVMANSRDDANSLCTDLKAAGGSCFVTR